MFLFSSFWYLEGIPVLEGLVCYAVHFPFKVWLLCLHTRLLPSGSLQRLWGFLTLVALSPFFIFLIFLYVYIYIHTHTHTHTVKFTILKCPSRCCFFFFFSLFTKLCDCHHCLIPEHFYHPQRNSPYVKWLTPFPTPSSSWQLLLYFSDAMNLPLMDSSYKWGHVVCGLLCGFFKLKCFQCSSIL